MTALTVVLVCGVASLYWGLLWLLGLWQPLRPPGWVSVAVVLGTSVLLLGALFRLDAP
ncbi:hypothetical protein QOL99_11700 [Deinococcus sp. MIMF12]|uniref:Uncharacterized protein n=1 Tax=Deinococcus rhizophilus TaxID=3049544 RepID=A0ABT7JJZ8_9DEIO|nr:hypothetical protein [Deinococcus rhizophilus]MDL2344810.1 hypothetical protein [Deinococcus rhizophilus]